MGSALAEFECLLSCLSCSLPRVIAQHQDVHFGALKSGFDLRAAAQFRACFIELARSIYRSNDERARIKRQISLVSGSAPIEEKSY